MLESVETSSLEARLLLAFATQDDKHTMKKTTLYLGLDVHKDSVAIAIAEGGRGGEVRFDGTISNDLMRSRRCSQDPPSASLCAPEACTKRSVRIWMRGGWAQ
jgi:hypothetical protein